MGAGRRLGRFVRPAVLAAAALSACGPSREAPPRAQLLVFVDTDALVPRMFDRLRVAVLDSSLAPSCDGCSRDFVLDGTTTLPASFGVPTSVPSRAAFLRLLLYPAGRTVAGAPATATAIDRVVRLAPAAEPGVARRFVFLSTDCVGRPADLASKTTCIDATRAADPIDDVSVEVPSTTRVGTWHAEVAEGCSVEPRTGLRWEEEVCIRGGVFWLGDTRQRGWGRAHDAVPERAVAIRPFLLDKYEMTVGRFRALVAAGAPDEFVSVRGSFASRPDKDKPPRWHGQDCNYTPGPADPAADSLPLNCLHAKAAAVVCKYDGGRRLPTEAEWEWAAGSREEERFYPWGDLPRDPKEGPDEWKLYGAPYGERTWDRTRDGLADMGGNVQEWTADVFEPYSEGCWEIGSFGPSPRCATKMTGPIVYQSVRGNIYDSISTYEFIVAYRSGIDREAISYSIGLRCARDATAP